MGGRGFALITLALLLLVSAAQALAAARPVRESNAPAAGAALSRHGLEQAERAARGQHALQAQLRRLQQC